MAQFEHSEFYAVGRFGIGMGMNSYSYFSELEGSSIAVPSSIQIDLGSGFIPELGLGLKIDEFIYVETSVSFAKTEDFYMALSGGNEVLQGYSFNRYAIQLNGKYYVPVNKLFVMDFNAGLSVTIPEQLVVKMKGYTEIINYAGSNGLQAGFAGNYINGALTGSAGIRYRLERFTLKQNQDLPENFETLNPSFSKISSSGIDLVFSILYNF